MKAVLIHYFTGTGNTYHAVKLLGGLLGQAAYEVDYINIEKGQSSVSKQYEHHLFAFPVYGFGLPAIVKKYLKALEASKGAKASVLSIGGQTGNSQGVLDRAFEGDALLAAAKILHKKGFKIKLTELLAYPENWTQLFNPPNPEVQEEIFSVQDKLVQQFSERIIGDSTNCRRVPLSLLLLSKLVNWCYSHIGRRILGKFFIADHSCSGCGKCSRLCPVQNIKLHGKDPRWQWHCEGCQRCINTCPSASIQTSTVRLVVLLVMQLVPIALVVSFNRSLPVPWFFDIILYGVFAFILTAAADFCLGLLEKVPAARKTLQRNFTEKFRRYVSKDIHFK